MNFNHVDKTMINRARTTGTAGISASLSFARMLANLGNISILMRSPPPPVANNGPIVGPADTDIIYILPISGAYFPLQMLALITVQDAIGNIAPNVVLGTSGGSVVSAAGMSGFWKASAIRDNALLLSADQIFTRPSRLFGTCLNLAFSGAAMLPQPDVYKLAVAFLKDRMIQHTEMIIGTYCINMKEEHLFSSKSPSASRYGGAIRYFLNGDWYKGMKTVLASCAIPSVIRPVNIHSRRDSQADRINIYQDGGMYAPSPWSTLWNQIVTTNKKLKIVYFVSTTSVVTAALDVLMPLYLMIRNQCDRESSSIIASFKLKAGQTVEKLGAPLDVVMPLYAAAPQALLIVKTDHVRHGYSFDIFNFGRLNMLEILGRKDVLEFDLYYATP